MAHLSSCYFCGVAIDEPLRTYRVSGVEQAGEAVTVTLCSACQHKLDTVLDAAGQAELSPVTDDAAVETTTPAGQSPDSQPETTDQPSDEVETVGAGVIDEDEMVTESDDRSVEADTDSTDETDEDRSVNPLSENDELLEEMTDSLDAEGIGEETLTESDVEDEMAAAGFDERPGGEDGSPDAADAVGDTDSEDASDSIAAEAEPDVPDEFETTSVGDRSDDTDAGETGESAGSGGTGESETPTDSTDETRTEGNTGAESGDETQAAEPRTSISALEYNKVMRLLQNREFPVERGEIVTIASSAYDLREDECRQVVDLAVDRGLLVERDGQLYRPED